MVDTAAQGSASGFNDPGGTSLADTDRQRWLAAVRPPNWQNPTPADRYDLVVIGGGPGGLVAAAGAAGLGIGLKVALVERLWLGGDCLNVGCVPSKALLRSAQAAAAIAEAAQFGVVAGSVTVDFAAVMARVRRLRSELSPADSADRFRALGVDVFFGQGAFVDPHTISVTASPTSPEKPLRLSFRRAIIATGARSQVPEIPGLAAAGFLTNETIFELTERPNRLAILGGGPIGCELGQALARLGVNVTLIQRGDRLLPRDDRRASEWVRAALERDGVSVLTQAQVVRVESDPATTGKVLGLADGRSIVVDEILLAAGRRPNVAGLDLAAAGLEAGHDYDETHGIRVNDYLQTRNRRVWAIGDVAALPGPARTLRFTHAADAMARLALRNALFAPFGLGKGRFNPGAIPWATYTDPEVVQVGLTAAEAEAQSQAAQVIEIALSEVDRAQTDGETEGLLRVVHQGDRLLGATCISRHAGEMMGELGLAIAQGIKLSQLANLVRAYPSQSDCIKKAADSYRRQLLTPRSRRLLALLAKLS